MSNMQKRRRAMGIVRMKIDIYILNGEPHKKAGINPSSAQASEGEGTGTHLRYKHIISPFKSFSNTP